jgi:PAS domain S-box-containing protein
VWLLNLSLAALATWLFAFTVVDLESLASPVVIPWWALAAMFFVAEAFVVHVELRLNSHSISMSEIPFVLGLFFAAPWALVLGHFVGALLALTLHRRQTPIKLAFNLAQFCLGSSLAVIVFSTIGPADPLSARGWVAAVVAVLVAETTASASMIAALSLSEGELQLKARRAIFGDGTIPVLVNASLALAGATLLWVRPPSVILLFVPAGVLMLGYRAYTSIRARHQGLEFLYETIREVQGAANAEEAVEIMLRRAASMFRAQRAEMVFLPVSEGAPAFRTSLADDKVEAIVPLPLEPKDRAGVVASFREARLVVCAEEPSLSLLFLPGIHEALVAPLVTADETTGFVLVGNREGDVAGFDSEDLKLFQTLANHASVLLERGSLQQSLHRLTEEMEERERTERLLREAQAKYRSLVEDVPAIVYISPLRNDSSWSYVSPQIASVLGFSPQEWLAGPTWHDRLHPEDRERVSMERAQAAGSDQRGSFVSEYRLLAKDGRVVWVSDEATIVRREDQPLFYRGVLFDVTRRKQAEADKGALEVQLRQAQKMEAIGELAGGVAHDFNNLLAVIRNYASFVDEELDAADPKKEDLDEILKASERATALVRQLLTFSRKEIIRPELVDLNHLVGELHSLLKRALRESITTVVRLEEDLPTVEMDPGQVHQLLLNLAINAQDAMPDGGTLVIETSIVHVEANAGGHFDSLEPGPHACVAVSDTGTGMSAEVKSRIFEPFYTTKGRASGTGLGLSTVYGAIKRAGGHIAVYSREGLGTTFKIYLPARSQSISPAPAAPWGTPAVGARPVTTVLVAEDEPGVRNVVERVLSGHGHRVLAADSADSALAAARAEPGPLHLLLTDLVMPERSGRELAEEMATLRPGIACLYMSGYPDEVLGRHGVLSGDEELLHKPFSAAELLGAVEASLDRAGAPRP